MTEDGMVSNLTCDQLSQSESTHSIDLMEHQQSRSTFDIMFSQAQNSSNVNKSQIRSRKRSNPSVSYSDIYSDSDNEYIPPTKHQPKKRNTQYTETQSQPTMVIITSPDVKLARINPIKIAKALNSIGKDLIKNVSKNNQGGITVRCYNAAQAKQLMTITKLDQWTVNTTYAKSEIQCKGVINGISTDISDDEILSACKKQGVFVVKRLMKKRNGTLEKSLSICLTFNSTNLPAKIQIGYEMFLVKPYIPPVIRCFNCQRLGHVANNCRSFTRCVRCGGSHNYDQCQQKDNVKCCRCGERHSSAYGGCNTIKRERKIQGIRVSYNISYADAAKAIRTDIIIDQNTPSQMTPTNQKRVETEDKYNQRNNRPTVSTNKEDTFLAPVIKYIKSTKEASTQTDSVAETQTESQQGIGLGLPSEQFWIELLTGTMQIWETVKNKSLIMLCTLQKKLRKNSSC